MPWVNGKYRIERPTPSLPEPTEARGCFIALGWMTFMVACVTAGAVLAGWVQ